MTAPLAIRRPSPSERVADVLPAGVLFYVRDNETPEQTAAAYERRFGRAATEVICVGAANWVRVGKDGTG